jgi:hypothetical protein
MVVTKPLTVSSVFCGDRLPFEGEECEDLFLGCFEGVVGAVEEDVVVEVVVAVAVLGVDSDDA